MKLLSKEETQAVSGGEVGATGMGDDYHYTGETRSFQNCWQDVSLQELSQGRIASEDQFWGCAYEAMFNWFNSR